jgi:hypothetical protein
MANGAALTCRLYDGGHRLYSVNHRRGRAIHGVMFGPELREAAAAGDISVSIRLWARPQVNRGGPIQDYTMVYRIQFHVVRPKETGP